MKTKMSDLTSWLIGATSVTTLLLIIYLILHFSRCCIGHEEVLLSREQLSAVDAIIIEHDDSLESSLLVFNYIDARFELLDREFVKGYILNTNKKDLQKDLPTLPLKVKSFFWLGGQNVLWEVVFWSLFGLMANLFFSVTTAKAFDPKQIPEHIGKFFYTPFLAVIVYLSLNALVNTGSIVLEGVGKSVIVLSFILGFYTRRAIVLLGRVKDLILPAKERDTKTDDVVTDDVSKEGFENLPLEDQKRIINEYIIEEADHLKESFPEIQGISARRKKKNGLTADFYCVHFDVIEKDLKLPDGKKIPASVKYTDKDNKEYLIQTDVSGSGENKLAFIPAKFHGDGEEPKQLGLSCSREGVNEMGTIGLKVYKKGEAYLLSCYHVLCAPEMKMKIPVYNEYTSQQPSGVCSPGTKDGKNKLEIADVTEGKLNHFIDAAIARLRQEESLSQSFYKSREIPKGTIKLNSDHVDNNYTLKLTGRTSGHSKGELIDSCQGVVYFTDYPESILPGGKLYNLIVTEKISSKGDSGAAVVDNDKRIVGMLVGDCSSRSYIIPIHTIINQLGLDEL